MGFTDRLLSFVISKSAATMSQLSTAKITYQQVTETLTSSTFILFVTAFLTLVYIRRQFAYLSRLPPGPNGIPVLGSLAKFTKPFHLQMTEFGRQFAAKAGGLFSVRMGSQLIVCINDPKMLKKVFARSEFTARPKSALDSIVEGYGLITADGQLWQNQRKYLHKYKFGLKFWGNISETMETRVNHEVLDCLTALARDTASNEKNNTAEDSGLDLSPYLSCSISNVICSIIMSTRFRHHTQRFAKFINYFDEGFRLFTLTGPMIFLPWLRFIPNIRSTVDKLKANRAELLNFVGEIVEDHKVAMAERTKDVDGNSDAPVEGPRDLVDQYLLEINARREAGTLSEAFDDKDPETQLKQVLVDLFSAGFETVKTTLLWTIIHVLRNPEVKSKVEQELESVVGPHRMPTMEDMSKLTYTRATIYESMRRTTAVPMGTTHSNSRPVVVDGHLIPANSHVMPNLYAIHMDPELWEEPEQFRPERFLQPTEEDSTTATAGVKVVKPKHFLPFGTGARMCLGDSLAEMELQLFFASLMHVFDVDKLEGVDLPSLEGNFGATLTPDAFKVRLVPKNVEALIAANMKAKPANYLHMRTYG